jgi:predicted RecA/RadA family phage recombinase
MAQNHVRGDLTPVTWTNGGSAVTAGAVVKNGQRLGVALSDIAGSASGTISVTGVFVVPKVSAAVIAHGETLTWDVSAGAFDDNAATPATGDVTGPVAVAEQAAGNGVTSMQVRFTGVPGTVT